MCTSCFGFNQTTNRFERQPNCVSHVKSWLLNGHQVPIAKWNMRYAHKHRAFTETKCLSRFINSLSYSLKFSWHFFPFFSITFDFSKGLSTYRMSLIWMNLRREKKTFVKWCVSKYVVTVCSQIHTNTRNIHTNYTHLIIVLAFNTIRYDNVSCGVWANVLFGLAAIKCPLNLEPSLSYELSWSI